MLPLALLAICCATSWADAAPPSAGETEGDLRASVVFNQLAIAELMEQVAVARSQESQLRDLVRGLADVNSSVEILGQSLTSFLQQDVFLERELQLCGNLTEVLQRRVAGQEDEIRERREANAALKAKHRHLQQELLAARARMQELQQSRFGLQAEDAQLKYEEAEVKIEKLEAKTALRRLQEEKTRLETELRVLEQRLSGRHSDQELETLLSQLRQRITEISGATDSLALTKGTLAGQKTALARDADEIEAANERLDRENESLAQEDAQTQPSVQDLRTAVAQMGEKIGSLANQRSDLQRRYETAVKSKEEALRRIGTLNAQMRDIKRRISVIAC